MSSPARGNVQSVGEMGKGSVIDLRVFVNKGSVERGGTPDETGRDTFLEEEEEKEELPDLKTQRCLGLAVV